MKGKGLASAPADARPFANAAPMPVPPPVTTAVRPSSENKAGTSASSDTMLWNFFVNILIDCI